MRHYDELRPRRLYRGDGLIAGVCEGIADYFDFNVLGMRLLFILVGCLTAFLPVIVIYVVMALTLRKAPSIRADWPRWE